MRAHYVKFILVVTCCVCAAAAFSWVNHRIKVQQIDEKIAAMPTKVVCIGRFLIDVPTHAIVTYRSASVAGWNISTIKEDDEEFALRLQKKEDLLTNSRNERGAISLEQVRNVKSDEGSGKIFLFDRKWTALMRAGKETMSETVTIDALVRSNGNSYEFKSDFRRDGQVGQLEKIVHQLQGRPEAHIPEMAGFCFDQGLIRDPLSSDDNENTSIFLGVKEHPDLAVSLSTFAGITNTRTLLQRDVDSGIQQKYASQFHRLRAGARSLDGMPGEEVLERVDELNGAKVHGFMWESIGDKTDIYRPSLSLELDTGLGRPGKPINSSLSDAEAIAWWEKISSSLRRRPVR